MHTPTAFDARRYLAIPFVKGLSEDIRFTLNKVGLDTVYTIPKKLDLIIKKGKDKLNKDRETDLVYRINCGNCDASYIGQTKRYLKTRINEHRNDIKKDEGSRSVVSKHRAFHQHDFKWLEVDILHKENNVRKREIAEMFFIKNQANTVNLQKDTENLNPIYDKVISSI
ncbi:uncharacterized protein [Temnothorax nylanderi]|uniref:uncharacterized protein n=1 Tax=Temnothorax nylanderi TaxID=102681 RepID=UPI003A89F332